MNAQDDTVCFLKRIFRRWKKVLIFIGITTLCSLVISVVLSLRPDESITVQNNTIQKKGMPVSVRVVAPKSYPALVKSFGEVVPLWKTTIKSQVDGKIIFLSKKLQVGSIVKKGELLVQLEKSEFEMHVAEARSRLASAKVALLREQQEGKQARKNWERSNIKRKPDSPLVLRVPQLEMVKSDVAAAQSALKRAEVLLRYTDIRAPFDGVIMQSNVSLGETLNIGFTGGEIATIYSLDAVEVGVQLDREQWSMLAEPHANETARLYTPQRDSYWDAEIVRKSLHLDRKSRLQTLFMKVKRPLEQTPPLLPGTFVEAEITGREIQDLVEIPETALTKQGVVWFVDKKNRLQSRRVNPVFYGEGVVYIHVPADIGPPIRIAESPNTSFVCGLSVSPKPPSVGGR